MPILGSQYLAKLKTEHASGLTTPLKLTRRGELVEQANAGFMQIAKNVDF